MVSEIKAQKADVSICVEDEDKKVEKYDGIKNLENLEDVQRKRVLFCKRFGTRKVPSGIFLERVKNQIR